MSSLSIRRQEQLFLQINEHNFPSALKWLNYRNYHRDCCWGVNTVWSMRSMTDEEAGSPLCEDICRTLLQPGDLPVPAGNYSVPLGVWSRCVCVCVCVCVCPSTPAPVIVLRCSVQHANHAVSPVRSCDIVGPRTSSETCDVTGTDIKFSNHAYFCSATTLFSTGTYDPNVDREDNNLSNMWPRARCIVAQKHDTIEIRETVRGTEDVVEGEENGVSPPQPTRGSGGAS